MFHLRTLVVCALVTTWRLDRAIAGRRYAIAVLHLFPFLVVMCAVVAPEIVILKPSVGDNYNIWFYILSLCLYFCMRRIDR